LFILASISHISDEPVNLSSPGKSPQPKGIDQKDKQTTPPPKFQGTMEADGLMVFIYLF
jgi:hypothetical protein